MRWWGGEASAAPLQGFLGWLRRGRVSAPSRRRCSDGHGPLPLRQDGDEGLLPAALLQVRQDDLKDCGGGAESVSSALQARPPSRARLLTVVHRQNLAAVHLHKAAEGQLSVLDPSLLGPLQGDPLATQPNVKEGAGAGGAANRGASQTHLVVVVVHQTADHVGLLQVQLLQHVGRV